MAIKETSYAKGEAGYKALVSDFTEMFDWDDIKETQTTDTEYTEFKKNCDDNTFVSLCLQKPLETLYTRIYACVTKDKSVIQSSTTSDLVYCAYTSGNGFFVLCASLYSMPNTYGNRVLIGISTCRNIMTGDSGWCAFKVPATTTSTPYWNPYIASKESIDFTNNAWSVNKGSKIGGAVSLHDPQTGCVSDKIMILTAIPDSYSACITPVIFNGSPYTRLGHILVPST